MQTVDADVEPNDIVILEVHGYLTSVSLSHIIVLWRATITKGAIFRCVLFNTLSLKVVKSVALDRFIDFRLCPNATNKVHWFDPDSAHCDECETHCCVATGTTPKRHHSAI